MWNPFRRQVLFAENGPVVNDDDEYEVYHKYIIQLTAGSNVFEYKGETPWYGALDFYSPQPYQLERKSRRRDALVNRTMRRASRHGCQSNVYDKVREYYEREEEPNTPTA